jgi:hypothetical protein
MTTLADLLVQAHLHRAHFPESAFHSMSKAVRRVAKAAGTLPQNHDAGDVLVEHAALAGKLDIGPKQFREEQANLKRLLALPGLPEYLSQRIYAGKATIEDALALVGLQDDPKKWEQVAMALRSFANMLQEGAATVIGGRRLERLLANHSHLDVGLEESTWQVRKSLIRRGGRLVDPEAKQPLKTSKLSGPWRELVEAANPGRGQKGTRTSRRGLGHHVAKIGQLVAFCWREGVEPGEVNDSVVQRFLSDFEAQKGQRAFDNVRGAIYSWEALQAAIPGWPQQKLSRLYRSRATSSPHVLQFADLPEELQASWTRYVEQFFGETKKPESLADFALAGSVRSEIEEENPFKRAAKKVGTSPLPEGPCGVIGRNEDALPSFKTAFLYAANAAIEGLDLAPRSVADVLTPETLRIVIDVQHERQCKRAAERGESVIPSKKNATLKSTVARFKAMATDLGVDATLIEQMDYFYDEVHPDFIGWKKGKNGNPVRMFARKRIGPRHRRMLKQFVRDGGDRKLLAWFQMPSKLFDSASRKCRRVGAAKLNDQDICDLITAIVGAIMRSAPLRRENLGELRVGTCPEKNLGPNIYIPRELGRQGRIHLWAGEIKKGSEDFECWLTPLATRVIRFYLDHVRPEVIKRRKSDPDNPYLFPACGMKHRHLLLITKYWVSRCREAGIEMDLHVNRHLVAKLVLDRDPTAMSLVQEILGHKNEETTRAYYADVNKALVQKKFQAHLEEVERALSSELMISFRRTEQ